MLDYLPAEELARARIYGLLARLFSAPPDAALLDAIANAGEVDAEDGNLVDAWLDLCCAAANTDEETASVEYRRAFAGRRGARAERMADTCNALRYAISTHPGCLAAQQRFFEQEARAAEKLCSSMSGALYRQIGRFGAAFLRIEQQAFALPATKNHPWRLNA
jgi:hypothetical protein